MGMDGVAVDAPVSVTTGVGTINLVGETIGDAVIGDAAMTCAVGELLGRTGLRVAVLGSLGEGVTEAGGVSVLVGGAGVAGFDASWLNTSSATTIKVDRKPNNKYERALSICRLRIR